MRVRTLACFVSLLAPVAAAAQTAPAAPAQPVVYAGLFTIRPDGSASGFAADDGTAAGEKLSGTYFVAPCGTMGGSSSAQIPQAATDVWQVTGTVTAFTPEAASVELTWQRVRQAGQDVNVPAQSRHVDLRRGERVVLDPLTIAAAGKCPERRVSLDVTFTERPATPMRAGGVGATPAGVRPVPASGATFIGGGGGISSGPSGGVVMVGASGGGGVGSTGAPGSGGVMTVPAGGGGRTVSVRAAAGGTTFISRPPAADVWLVHHAPNQDEQTEYQPTMISSFPRALTFKPITLQTRSGSYTVNVECFVEDGLSPEGEPRLFVSATRRVSFIPASGPVRDVRQVHEGSVKTAVPKPGPDDVLSFELPALSVPGAPSVPDRFSIRLRVAQP